jgi:hypothetical protein
MARPKKDEFDALSLDEKDMIASLKGEDLVAYVAKVAMDQAELMKAKEDDQDLAEKKTVAREAGAVYREGTRANKARIGLAKRIMEDRTGDFTTAIKNAASERRKTPNEERDGLN